MSGSEHGGNSTEQRVKTSPNRVLGARSASPAKRSASDMEDVGPAGISAGQQAQEVVLGSFPRVQDGGPREFDHQMASMTPASTSMDTQDTAQHSVATSQAGTLTANSSATSFPSEVLPSYAEAEKASEKDMTSYSTVELDRQHALVLQAFQSDLDVGEKGIVVSQAWLERVLSRTSEGLKNSEYPKEAREGPIGQIDNSSIVPDGAFQGPHLADPHGGDFIPLRPGLQNGADFQVLPSSVWGDVVGAYGLKPGQHQINRYATDTAPDGSMMKNVIYDFYPLIITIRKVPQPNQQDERPPTPPGGAMDKLRKLKEQRSRGQASLEDAIKLVASRSDRIQRFLKRSKESAGIPQKTKIKMWRVLNAQNITVDKPNNERPGVLSPPASRSTSPSKAARTTDSKLVLPPTQFKAMEIGKDMEHVDVKDETNNEKYSGTSTLETHAFFEDQTILLEEQIGGPAGGEFESDSSKKRGTKSFLGGSKKTDSKAGSTATSRGTSPAPGAMLTRGRARRDGRTRGVVGLSNLGNTCYMNSALQCIRSVEELAMFFLSGQYKTQINANNPLGHGGAMAKQYAGVLTGIYGDNASAAFSPSEFKRTLGRIQPLFSGYQQQDSQEFLSFLVDALHEDLNRIEKKPYIENPDSDDKTVHDPQAIIELGETYRSNHKARNDSICMDLFSGFYKNKMECPVCDKVSVTFDPYSLLTVQLPVENTFQHNVTSVPLNGAPINHAIDIDKNTTIKALKESIASKHSGVAADRLWMVEVYNHKIYKVFENHKTLVEDSIQPNDHIFVFELEDVPKNLPEPSKAKTIFYSSYGNNSDKDIPGMDSEKADVFAVPVFSRQKNRFGNSWEIIMHPLYVTLTREEAQDFEVILKKVLIAVSRQTSKPILTQENQDKEDAGDTTIVGDTEKDESAGEDAAQVSDRSVPSEDGYVEVSVGKPGNQGKTEEMADAPSDPVQKANPVPARFMDPQYVISPGLRNGLFAVNYAKSNDGMLCASMSSIEERSVRNMYDRVKVPARRASSESISEESTTSAATGQADGESEESDADDDEKPDLILGMGNEDALHLQTPTSAHAGSDDELPDDPIRDRFPKDNRRRKGKQGRKSKPKNYRKGTAQRDRQGNSGSLRYTQSQRSLAGKPVPQDDDEPYYVKLGEAIVIDWLPEGLDSLFGGDTNVDDDFRGQWLSSSDGKGLDFIPDLVLEQKRQKRVSRRKNGIRLEDCFVETGKREILSEDNAWYCNRCKGMRQAAKTLEIWTIPDILIVHMKRFGGNRSFRDKIDVLVDYPIEGLDMTKKVGFKEDGKEYVYDLFAVDNHYGGLGGGHYTAMAKSFYDGQWYDYNDSSCSKLGDAKLHSAAAYLLFYRRRSEKPLGPQYLQDLVTHARNPSEPESANEDAEEDESGEGKLGGTTSSLHGSSSALVVAGAGTNGNNRSTANGGATGAGSSLTKKTSQSDGGEPESPLGTLNGVPVLGPVRPPHLQYGSQGTATWGFDSLDEQPPAEADDGATERLLGNMGNDHDSTVAEHDSTFGGSDGLDRMNDFETAFDNMEGSSGRAGTPVDSIEMEDYTDNHNMYSSGRGSYGDDALHLENAGMIDYDQSSPEAAEIHVGGDESMDDGTHSKME